MKSKNVNSKKDRVSKSDILKFRGYKFFKENSKGSFDIIRLTGISEPNKENPKDLDVEVIVDNIKTTMLYTDLKNNYTPIKPEGMVSFNIVFMDSKKETKDVIVLMYKAIELAIGIREPYAVCRQSVNDFFSDFVVKDVSKNTLVGVSCTRDNCPANLDYNVLLSCSGIQRSDIVSYYKDDTLEDLIECIPVEKYNKVLNEMYEQFTPNAKDIILAQASQECEGWCRNLQLLLQINNALADFDNMNGVIGVDFDMSKHLDRRDTGVFELDYPSRLFLSEVIKCNIKETRVTEYNYSIDMSKFNNTSYTLIRDVNNKLYLIVYLVQGEFLEEELQDEINKLDVTDRLRLAYYNKYNNLAN